MKVLILSTPDPHYGADFLLLGFREMLGPENVRIYPDKETLHAPLLDYPFSLGISERCAFDQDQDSTKDLALIVQTCPRDRDYHGQVRTLLENLPATPLIIADQEDLPTPIFQFDYAHHELLHLFHRECDNPDRILPMCYKHTLGFPGFSQGSESPGEREIDFLISLSETTQERSQAVQFFREQTFPKGLRLKVLDPIEVQGGRTYSRPVSFEEYLRLLRSSKMVLSMPGWGLDTNRFWEAMANGCLVLSQEIKRPFPHPPVHDQHLLYWNSFEEAMDLVERMYRDPDKILEMGARAQTLVKNHHTALARARRISAKAQEML